MKRIIGIDASTKTIGIAILDFDGKKITLFHHEYFKPPKGPNIFQRLVVVKKYITDLYIKYKPDEIAIEEFSQFMGGRSSAKTIIPLAIFNRTVGLTFFELTNKEPHMCNVNSIRAKLKLTKERPSKEDMPELVAKHLNIEFPWYKKIHKKTKKEIIMEESFDVADAIAVGIFYIKTV